MPGGGGKPGQRVWLTADLDGGWRPGYTGRQWDSTSFRRTPELRELLGSVAKARPAAAKDVSMAGIAGTLGMLAEASGCGAVLDVEKVPRPRGASTGDWLTCFPGFAMLTTGTPAPAGPAVDRGLRRTGRGHPRHAALARRRTDARHRRRRHRIGDFMTTLRMAAVAAPFDRDLEGDFARIEKLIGEAKTEGVRLLALPEASLGGYLANLDGGAEGPPALALDGPELDAAGRAGGRPGRHGGVLRTSPTAAATTARSASPATACSATTARCTSRCPRTPATAPATGSTRSTRRSGGWA